MIMAFLNTFGWITLFFILTILSLILINMANGIYQSCLFACAANLPRSYTNAIVTGMNISGTFAAIVLILSLIISPDQRMAAICYFAMAVLFLIVCFLCQFALVQNVSHHNLPHFIVSLIIIADGWTIQLIGRTWRYDMIILSVRISLSISLIEHR